MRRIVEHVLTTVAPDIRQALRSPLKFVASRNIESKFATLRVFHDARFGVVRLDAHETCWLGSSRW